MLEYLRNASEKPVAKVLITILAFSFVGWGVAEWIFGNVTNDTTLVTVGDSEISAQQFNSEKSRELAQKSREEQRAIYADMESQDAFAQGVLTKIATQRMIWVLWSVINESPKKFVHSQNSKKMASFHHWLLIEL